MISCLDRSLVQLTARFVAKVLEIIVYILQRAVQPRQGRGYVRKEELEQREMARLRELEWWKGNIGVGRAISVMPSPATPTRKSHRQHPAPSRRQGTLQHAKRAFSN